MRKLINDPFSPSGPCSTSVTQSSHLALTTSCPPQPTNPRLANRCLFCPGFLPWPQATGLEKRFIQCGLPARGASLHTAVCAISGLGGAVPPGRIPGTQPSGTGEGTEGEGIPAQRDLSLAFGSGLRLALILQREMAQPCWEFELGHVEAPAALGCLCS